MKILLIVQSVNFHADGNITRVALAAADRTEVPRAFFLKWQSPTFRLPHGLSRTQSMQPRFNFWPAVAVRLNASRYSVGHVVIMVAVFKL